jgi:hypothetical protein
MVTAVDEPIIKVPVALTVNLVAPFTWREIKFPANVLGLIPKKVPLAAPPEMAVAPSCRSDFVPIAIGLAESTAEEAKVVSPVAVKVPMVPLGEISCVLDTSAFAKRVAKVEVDAASAVMVPLGDMMAVLETSVAAQRVPTCRLPVLVAFVKVRLVMVELNDRSAVVDTSVIAQRVPTCKLPALVAFPKVRLVIVPLGEIS